MSHHLDAKAHEILSKKAQTVGTIPIKSSYLFASFLHDQR